MTKGIDELSRRHAELRDRKSDGKFTKKFPDIKLDKSAGKFESALAEFQNSGFEALPFDAKDMPDIEKVGATSEVIYQKTPKDVFDGLSEKVQKAHGKLDEIAKKENGVWALKKSEKDADKLKKYEGKYAEAQEELSQFLRGEKVNGHKVPKKLSEAFASYEEAVSHAEGTLNGWFARAQLDGVGKAAERSMKDMAVWQKGNKAKSLGFAKSGVAVGGAAAIMHGVAVGKGSDGEDRNGFVRLGEVLLGAGAIGGALVFGKAR